MSGLFCSSSFSHVLMSWRVFPDAQPPSISNVLACDGSSGTSLVRTAAIPSIISRIFTLSDV